MTLYLSLKTKWKMDVFLEGKIFQAFGLMGLFTLKNVQEFVLVFLQHNLHYLYSNLYSRSLKKMHPDTVFEKTTKMSHLNFFKAKND